MCDGAFQQQLYDQSAMDRMYICRHDKYNYERLQMALHDSFVRRLLAFGISGLSVIADSLSAIKYAKVTPIRDERGIAVDFKVRSREFSMFVRAL